MAKHFSFLLFIALLLCACGKNALPQRDKLAEKSEPYDLFSFQRSYPYPDFDWKGWRKTVQKTRTSETAQSRGLNCGNNLTNWSVQGPMNVGGRCNALATKPDDENTVLAGFSGGGIFKSTDGAVNWHPVFDDNPELAIGDITFDPNPSILWTAIMGNPYVRDNQRGVYKSTDGGNTWQQVLFVSNQAGASDLVQSPVNPQIMYASFWDRIRNNFESVIYGPNAKVYKSTDGGNTWVQLTTGLPTGVMGRTGLAISQTNPDKVYVVYIDSLSTPGGLFKTTNGGTSWTPVNIVQLEDACSDFGWYFGKIRTNPTDDEELYFHAIQLWRKPAGNNGWFNAGSGHADSHDLIFTQSGRRYWSNDGGVYRNDGQPSWTKALNLPVTQFYRTTYNPHQPDKYWAGAQDNGIQKGNGLNPNNWQSVFSADGFSCAFDPGNPEHFWVETQNGAIHETTNAGDTWQFGFPALGTSDRTNWDTPLFMSPHVPNRLYSGTFRAYAKDAGGGWGSISGDLTDGIIFGARFHTISCINESPVTQSKLIAGTSDGNVWRREAAGAWTNITAGLPERYVTSVSYSPTLSNRLFVSHSGYRDNEHIPHIHRSDDNGSTWIDISSDLPQVPVNDLLVLPGYSDQVLFAATDVGVYFTTTGGVSWSRLGGNMPYIPVFDLERNPVRKELVAATFARGIWTFPFDSVFVQQNPVTVSLAGTVRDELGDGVIEVDLDGTLSDTDGAFSLQNVPGCAPYTLAPYRNDNPLNGVTTYDLVLISKHILDIEPFDSPLKMIAADANNSVRITTIDIVKLRKLILGIDTAFSNNTSWRFVPANHQFVNPLNPFETAFPETLAVQVLTDPLANLDFTGIKIGDVNNTAIPNLTVSADERTVGEWPVLVNWLVGDQWPSFAKATAGKGDWWIGDQVIGSNNSKDQGMVAAVFAVRGSYDPAPIAAQFTLRFNTEHLVFEKIEPLASGISLENFGLNRTGQGLMTFAASSDDLKSSDEAALFKVIFRTKGNIPLNEQISLVDWPTAALIYQKDGTALRPVLDWDIEKEAVAIAPNPFGMGGTWVSVTTPETLEVFDGSGKLLFSKNVVPKQVIHLEKGLFPQAGVYFWRLGTSTGKLVFTP